MNRIRPLIIQSVKFSKYSRGFKTYSRVFQDVQIKAKKEEQSNKNDQFKQSQRSKLEDQQRQGQIPLSQFIKGFTVATIFLVGGVLEGYWMGKTPENDRSVIELKDIERSPSYATVAVVNDAIQKIVKIVGEENITISEGEIKSHSADSSKFVLPKEDEEPYCVVYPRSAEQVSNIVKICYDKYIPIVPVSGGTSIEGHYIATRKGISLDLSRMNKLIALHEDDMDVVVQPGMEWTELNEILKPRGLMFGPDPAPGAMIGGIVSTNASGTNAYKFGGAKDNVLALKVVLADGTIIRTKRRSKKSSNGYNLTNLFIGAEGTLGIVVEATLKLHPLPKSEAIALMNFKTIGDATRAVADIVKSGIDCNALEFMDDRQMRAVIEMGSGGDRKWSAHHLLMMKLGGNNKGVVKESIKQVQSLGKKNGGFNFDVATNEADKNAIWQVRKTLLWNSLGWARKIKPNARVMPTDVCVPVSKLPALMSHVMAKMDDANLLATAAGHAGDGNLHILVIYEPEQIEIAHKLVNEMSREAIKLDGTISGEHGIGMSDKREFLEEELGEGTIGAMRSIKYALDKRLIMNPDHIFKIDPAEHRIANE
ncbi:hypothetical protein BRETT_002263 [Brettanomyces bruxellensis]|uniref:D-lactate dehydrogenase (cytochrome) n=1 Tax=Dekkera bruxellensis TaxID=5007 RepID=A0A871RD80_DEKBR|nr:uncharacterized protein BRETT_002263 [Brettanomyces bruxellensis]QOU22095.1 hypothetical protein BRETT_002263 [Brettanomyces bruxellensis]